MSKSILKGGLYLLKGLGVNYDIRKQFGQYAIYHAKDGFIARVATQREVRNEVRHHSVYGKIAPIYQGRE